MAGPKLRRLVLAAIAVGVTAATGYAARERLTTLWQTDTATATAPTPDRRAQPVRVTRVAFSALSRTETYTGTLRPRHETPLAFRLAGKLTVRLADVGDRVVAGQVLARLDDTDAQLELDAAMAEAAAAETDFARAGAEAARSRELFAAGHVAQAALDRAISGAAEAQSRAERAKRAVELASNQIAYTTLVAEADGVVTETPAEAGQVISAGQPVLSVAQTARVDVVFALPEQQRDLLAEATATATLWGLEGRSFALALRDISPDVDPAGRTYRVRMTLENGDAEAAFGRTATVTLTAAKGEPVIPLPLAAVMNDGAGTAVWRLPTGADHVERVAVEMVGMDRQVAQVRGPLAEGDLVISLGAHKIDPSRPVRVVETSPTPES